MVVSQRLVEAEGRRNIPPLTDQQRLARSQMMQKRLKEGGNVYSRCKHGKREDLGGQYFRSRWEANYARLLNFLIGGGTITKWEYEADTFWFEKIRRGVRSYTPDFKVWRPNGSIYYVEVKGWMDAKSATKLKRMKKYHPTTELQLVDAKQYRHLSKTIAGAIPLWESER